MIDCYSSEGDAAMCKILQTGRHLLELSNVMCLLFWTQQVIGQLLNNDLSVMFGKRPTRVGNIINFFSLIL